MAAIGKRVAVDAGLDLIMLLGVVLEPSNVDFDVEMADVAHNRVVGHDLKVLSSNDVAVAGSCDKNLAVRSSLFHSNHLVATDCCLKGINGVNLSDKNSSTHARKSHGTALADVAISGNNSSLTSNHNVCGALDSINKGLTAAVKVVELRLRDAVVDIDGRNLELTLGHHFVEVVHSSSGLLRETEAVFEKFGVLFVNKRGEITAIVKNEVQLASIVESVELLLDAPEILLLSLAFPGKNRNASSSNSSSSVVLSRVDVAGGPGDLSAETDERLDKNGGLNGHVEATSNAGALEGLRGSVLLAGLHETRHLVFSEFDLLAAESGKRQVGNLEIVSRCRHILVV